MLDSGLPTTSDLLALIEELQRVIQRLEEMVVALQDENAELRRRLGGGGSTTPHFVKANRSKEPGGTRKKRDLGFARKKGEPTETVVHTLDRCPNCAVQLAGGWVHRTREVIEIPVDPVQVIHHVQKGYQCGHCKEFFFAPMDLSDQVVGHHRMGIRLMSLVFQLAIANRVPVSHIRKLLLALYGLHVSAGEIAAILHTVADKGRSAYGQLLDTIRGSPFVHADETGWRERGVNGYLWSFSTPEVRYFHRDRSRGHQVPLNTLGSSYNGIVVSDFYAGYNYHRGLHQRCWVHLLRDLKGLRENFPDDASAIAWTHAVKNLYDEAKAFSSNRRPERITARVEFQRALSRLATPFANASTPQTKLAKRLLKHEAEMFTFVEYPDVPSENNAAERAVRPAVIARKISGGTRSKRGSETRSILMSLIATWQLQEKQVLDTCAQILR